MVSIFPYSKIVIFKLAFLILLKSQWEQYGLAIKMGKQFLFSFPEANRLLIDIHIRKSGR